MLLPIFQYYFGQKFWKPFLNSYFFKNLIEIMNLPFLVLGRSLMIKVNEIVTAQKNQVNKIKN